LETWQCLTKISRTNIGRKMNQQTIDDKIYEYTSKDWSILVDSSHIGFLSPCGRWFHSFEKSTGYMINIDKKWIENMRRHRKKDESIE
jgi:hypothetical protein